MINQFVLTLLLFIVNFQIHFGQHVVFEYDKNALSRGEVKLLNHEVFWEQNVPHIKFCLNDTAGSARNISFDIISSCRIEVTQEFLSKLNNTRFFPDRIVTVHTADSARYVFLPIIAGTAKNTVELIKEIRIYDNREVAHDTRSIQFVTESVLREGVVYRIPIDKSGIYKLDKIFLETKLGIDISKLDPKKCKIYARPGGIISETPTLADEPDLFQVPVIVAGEQDGKFDASDYLLFYAEGPDVWRYNHTNGQYSFQKNIYDNNNYVFLKITGDAGLRVEAVQKPAEAATLILDSYESLQRYETDKVNLLGANPATTGSGKNWYGDYFKGVRETDYQKEFDFSNLVVPGQIQAKMAFAGRSSVSSRVNFLVANQNFSANIQGTLIGDNEAAFARKGTIQAVVDVTTPNPAIKVSYPVVSAESEGWLDFIELIFEKSISSAPVQFELRHKKMTSQQIVAFNVSALNQHIFWDITNPVQPLSITAEVGQLKFATNNINRNILAFRGADAAFVPSGGVQIASQNLHGLMEEDLVIVYHQDFKEAAEKLAAHRSAYSGLKVGLADINQVYNEFSSGRVDPSAVRELAAMLYRRNEDFRYLLLFGDGSYDYKGLMPNLSRENFIPVYETEESLDPIYAFPSDDYFGLLEPEDQVVSKSDLDIAVGRLPVKTAAEALAVVQKIIHYDTSRNTLGEWRLRTGFAADDQDANRHITDMDEIARYNESNDPVYNQQKVYFDAFPLVSTAGDPRYPEASRRINSQVLSGQLTLTYLGHGGPLGWAQERVLTNSDIRNWTNFDRLCLLITATCSFAAYDDPKATSPGEEAILNPKGGAIALFSTTRAVFTTSNKELTEAVHEELYKQYDGQGFTLGEILKNAKNKRKEAWFLTNARKFTLLGDPAQRLALPEYNVKITSINDKTVGIEPDTLSALKLVKINGEVTDGNQLVMNDFNGKVDVTIFDKKSKLKTLMNTSRSPVFGFESYNNIIFKGTATVSQGKWQISFWVPKDINYAIGPGRISAYAYDNQGRDAAGYTHQFMIGGPTKEFVKDDKGPDIQLYLNDEQFVDGGMTDPNPVLIANLSDDYGINVTGTAVGHDIAAYLDGDSGNSFVLNDFYTAMEGSYSRGQVRYPLRNLAYGRHSLTLKAWDISNNSAEESIDFFVTDNEEDIIQNVLNFPNPVIDFTRFQFETDLNKSPLRIQVFIYDAGGSLVRTLEKEGIYQGNRISDVEWNAEGTSGNKLPQGVYFYTIKVEASALKQIRISNFEKLVIL